MKGGDKHRQTLAELTQFSERDGMWGAGAEEGETQFSF